MTRFRFSEVHMGMEVRATVYAPTELRARSACRAAFDRIAAVDAACSDYREDSELMRLCGRSGAGPVAVSKELMSVLERAQSLAAETEGAFDVTAGPFVRLWREARKNSQLPAEPQLQSARQQVGWTRLVLRPEQGTAELTADRMQLDLGGIAKGYALDEALAALRRHGVDRAMLECGGDIRLGDAPPEAEGWRVRIENAPQLHGEEAILSLENVAVASSGDTEQFVEIEGRRYSHVVDPRTGVGLSTRIAVTVVAPDGITADSLATAISVLGREAGHELARRHEVESWIRTLSSR